MLLTRIENVQGQEDFRLLIPFLIQQIFLSLPPLLEYEEEIYDKKDQRNAACCSAYRWLEMNGEKNSQTF